MPRGRVLTADFWTDETLIACTPYARLFYAGLWNFAWCDDGHLPDEPFSLKLKVLPSDPVDGHQLVAELMGVGKLTRGELADGTKYLWMPTFRRHQKVDPRWKTRCPVCNSAELTETQESLVEHTGTLPNSAKRGKGEKGKEEKGDASSATPFCNQHPNGTDKACRRCGDARRAFEATKTAVKNRPTVPGIVTEEDCPKHPYYPARGCTRCAEEQ